ncbi:MAG: S1-like domain-containing RNA-binding protein [Campylobacterota bacterium]|nr:S1-like domain-containing RNA-binding protein [Campylobacterota bacterium]
MNNLIIRRDTDHGFFLESADEEEVLLPNAFITDDMNIDDIINVFIYTDSEDRLIATTQKPLALKNEFAFVKVVDVVRFGAFVDIGLQKDLLVPRNKQKTPFEVGEHRIVRIVEDEESGRLMGIEKITSFLSKETAHFKQNDDVTILVMAKTPLGFKVIVNNSFEGLVYANEIFGKLYVGTTAQAYIKAVREDGKLDISLQPIGADKKLDVACTTIFSILKKNAGVLPYNYKSDASVIQKIFGLSKKNYKKALTTLQNEKKIELTDDGMKLTRS